MEQTVNKLKLTLVLLVSLLNYQPLRSDDRTTRYDIALAFVGVIVVAVAIAKIVQMGGNAFDAVKNYFAGKPVSSEFEPVFERAQTSANSFVDDNFAILEKIPKEQLTSLRTSLERPLGRSTPPGRR